MFHIRWMIGRDVPEVADIDLLTHGGFAWSASRFHTMRSAAGIVPLVVEHQGRVVGYLLYWKTDRTLSVERLVVHRGFRRQGIGTILLDTLKRKLGGMRTSVMIQVRRSNNEARQFVEACGFRCTAINDSVFVYSCREPIS